jgi:hypothetical protein
MALRHSLRADDSQAAAVTGSVYESPHQPIIDKRCMQCHHGCNPNIPNLSGFDNLAILVRDLRIHFLD